MGDDILIILPKAELREVSGTINRRLSKGAFAVGGYASTQSDPVRPTAFKVGSSMVKLSKDDPQGAFTRLDQRSYMFPSEKHESFYILQFPRDVNQDDLRRLDMILQELKPPPSSGTDPVGGQEAQSTPGPQQLAELKEEDYNANVILYHDPKAYTLPDGAIVKLMHVQQSRHKVLTGFIAVKNLEYRKHVTVRYTVDDWKTAREVDAPWVESITSTVDRFRFRIEFEAFWNSGGVDVEEVSLCIRYQVRSQTHWDNNQEKNYTFKLVKDLPAHDDDDDHDDTAPQTDISDKAEGPVAHKGEEVREHHKRFIFF